MIQKESSVLLRLSGKSINHTVQWGNNALCEGKDNVTMGTWLVGVFGFFYLLAKLVSFTSNVALKTYKNT